PSAPWVPAWALGVAWEIVENTPAVIAAYRKTTLAAGYTGDTIANSLADVVACLLGYAAAMSLPAMVSAAGVVAVEAALLMTIRDSLLLSIVMLLRPIEAIRTWQAGGRGPPRARGA